MGPVAAYQYDSAGLELSFGYNRWVRSGLTGATFYIYPIPPTHFIGVAPRHVEGFERRWLEGAFEQAMVDIKRNHMGMTIES